MDPEIRYCTTTDGASIAYATMGAGPVVIMVSVFSFSGLLRVVPSYRALCDAMARQFTLVQYDGRGMGLSARERREYDLGARLKDLEAVIDAVGGDTFVLFGTITGGLAALAYAARHPQHVARLVLLDSFANGERFFRDTPAGRVYAALGTVTAEQWEFVSEAMAARMLRADAAPSAPRDLAALYRETWAPADLLAHRQASREIDVSGELAAIAIPTLVIWSTGSNVAVFEHSRELASAIPNARLLHVRLVSVPGGRAGWDERDLAALLAFLGADAGPVEVDTTAPRSELPHGTAVILFADIVESTALTEKMGDAAFRARERELDAALRSAIHDSGGTPVEGKLLGDGVLAVFSSAREAIDAALRCGVAGEAQGLPLHLGLHAGDVIREENNVFGGAVNIASRISGLSAPGEVLVSRTVADLARTSAGVTFEDRGEQALKGVADPVHVYAVRGGESER